MNQAQEAEFERHGHFPRACRANRPDCPITPHCATCAARIEEDPADWASTTGWRHDPFPDRKS